MEEEKGKSIGDIFKTIFVCKWLALIIAVVITVAGTLALHLGYNRNTSVYARKFSVIFPGSDMVTPVFPDNSPFDYRNIVSFSNLSQVKGSDEKFAYIDIEKMAEDDGISISRSTEEIAGQVDINYTLTVKTSYFKSKADAADFIDALTRLPINYITKLAIDQDLYVRDYDSTPYYEAKASMLSKQVEYIRSSLEELSNQTAGNLKNSCERLLITLDQYKQKLDMAIGTMRAELYAHNENVVADYEAQLITLRDQLESTKRELDIIFGRVESGDLSIDYNEPPERALALAKQVAELESRISVYEYYVKAVEGGKNITVKPEFATELATLNEQIKSLTDNYELLLGQYYAVASTVSFDGGIATGGGISIIISGLVSLVLGVIVAAVVAYIVGSKKQQKAAKTTEEAPSAEPNAEEQQ